MKTRLVIAHVTLVVFVALSAVAQTASDEFEQGNALYRDGKYEPAVGMYEAILRQGYVSAPLYFNLGNSYYRLGKSASSILAYERALRLSPGDADIEHNLGLANLKTVDRIEPLPELFIVEWLRSLSAFLPPHTTLWLLAASWAALFTSLALLVLITSPLTARMLRLVTVGALVLLVPLAVLAGMQIADEGSHNEAIVTAATTTAKTSPDAQSVDAFVIHEGLKVRLSDAVSGWVKIVLADGKVGWIRTEECERI
jgi:tetratricopeptide (TPR) repeat protein